ncbi:MAG: lipocalin family protein [Spirosomataceae bacterium]
MKATLFFIGFLFIGTPMVLAQLPSNMTGTWKRTAMSSVTTDGKVTDYVATLEKTMPCSKDMTYTFKADGSFITHVPDACGSMKKTLESMNAEGKGTMKGNKVTVVSSLLPPATYDVTFSGNIMTWYFDYAANPKIPNPGGKLKSMTIVYTKL